MGDYIVESKEEAIKMLRMVSQEGLMIKGNLKYALAEGIIALEKQIPKKPVEIKERHNFQREVIYKDGYCPICKNEISSGYVYCNSCGQKLTWEVEE